MQSLLVAKVSTRSLKFICYLLLLTILKSISKKSENYSGLSFNQITVLRSGSVFHGSWFNEKKKTTITKFPIENLDLNE